jgi:hypothetical protein
LANIGCIPSESAKIVTAEGRETKSWNVLCNYRIGLGNCWWCQFPTCQWLLRN